ncbi:MAG: Bax inhibitor-1/YccA family protein [Gammaproteobacteria bacterium]
MNQFERVVTRNTAGTSVLATNKVIRNTYALLAMTLLFSAACAGIAMALDMPSPGLLVFLVGSLGLSYLTTRYSHSATGLIFIFAFTGFMGAMLGPILNLYLRGFSNGGELIMMALGGTGALFLGLSGYALTSRRNFSFMRGMLFTGVWVAFLAGIGALVFHLPGLSLAVSVMFVVLMSGMILYQTSELVNGGETNYILATITLYTSLFNLFISLLRLLGVFGGRN